MTLNQARYFIAVCENGSISKAAKEIYISQPAISVALRELEEEIGANLFVRTPNGLQLTTCGEVLWKQSRDFIAHYERMMQQVQISAMEEKVLRIGVAPMCGAVVLPDLCRKLYAEHPEIRLIMHEKGSKELLTMLRNGLIDVALVAEDATKSSRLEFNYKVVKDFKLMFCVNHSHELASRNHLSIQDISDVPVILYHKDFLQSIVIENSFRAHQLKLNVAYRTGQLATVERFIQKGICAGFMYESLLREKTEIKSFLIPEIPSSSWCLFWKKDQIHPHTLRMFLNTI